MKSKQLLLFAFEMFAVAWQYEMQTAVTADCSSKQLLLFFFARRSSSYYVPVCLGRCRQDVEFVWVIRHPGWGCMVGGGGFLGWCRCRKTMWDAVSLATTAAVDI